MSQCCYRLDIANVVGIIPTILYEVLYSKALFSGCLENEVCVTTREIISETSMSIDQVKLAIKKLVDVGLISYTLRGTPQKRYFKVFK